MSDTIQKVAVIGAGVMGAGIAAQVANAGVDVVLLDIVPKGADNRNVIAEGAVQKLLKSKPAALMHKKFAKRITTGNIEDHLALLKECDWIIEAVIERLDIKQDLYKKISKHRKKGAIVSSNTSTIPLADLTAGMGNVFQEHFLITHFFNPPRYMRLLELVCSEKTSPSVVERVRTFGDVTLGKNVVDCYDRPGFIANRIGTFWLHAAVTKAIKHGVGVEEADTVLSRPVGVPKTGVFGLLDLVGLDLMPHIFKSFEETLPQEDVFHSLGKAPDLLQKMIDDGYTGRKGKGGFYRLNAQKKKEVIDLKSGDYHAAKRPKVEAALAAKKGGLEALFNHSSPEGAYAWDVLSSTLCYAASLCGEIAENIELIDRAMRLGYNWKYGPFELIDKMGASAFIHKLKAEGRSISPLLKHAQNKPFYRTHHGILQYLDNGGHYKNVPRAEGVLLLEDVKRQSTRLFGNKSASVWDLGDGVACLEFHSKMNSFNPFIINMINKSVKEVPERGFKGLVIHNEGTNFSVGANIAMLLITSKLHLWPVIRWILKSGQDAFQRLKYAPFPVVGGPSGMALGGGCEVLLHCNAVEAHAETYIGLVEAGVGIIPGWGGCKEMLGRWQTHPKNAKGPMPQVAKSFEKIATATVATSAAEAVEHGFFTAHDGIVMNRERVLAACKARVLAMAEGYTPPAPFTYNLPGPTGKAALDLAITDFAKKGVATPHDVVIAGELAVTLSGGKTDMTEELSEGDILKLERDAIVKLCKTKATQARVVHMLKKGKPLRN